MSTTDLRDQGYLVPTYRAPSDACWYHFLHGNVPGHQIDFIYRSEVPAGPLTQQHFSHLARIIKYIEPRPGAPCAFAIVNLSRDDTQHEPGHGGIALILGHRMKGATDHAGRRDPPFAHGIAAADRSLDREALFGSVMAFCRHVLVEPAADDPRALAPMYSRFAVAEPAERTELVKGYVAGFDDLPTLEPSRLSMRWTRRGAPASKRVVIVYPDDAPFEALARCASRVAAMLYVSDIRWTSITTGREQDIPNGVSIRFVPQREAPSGDPDTRVVPLEQVPEDEEGIAAGLFGAAPLAGGHATIPQGAWRSSSRAAQSSKVSEELPQPEALLTETDSAPVVNGEAAPGEGGALREDATETEEVTLVRPPLVRFDEEPAAAAIAVDGLTAGAEHEDKSGEDIEVTWDEPAAEVALTERVEGRDSRIVPSAAIALERAREGAEDDLPPELRPRRRGLLAGVALACVVGLVTVMVFAGRITASGGQGLMDVDVQSAPESAARASVVTAPPEARPAEGAAGGPTDRGKVQATQGSSPQGISLPRDSDSAARGMRAEVEPKLAGYPQPRGAPLNRPGRKEARASSKREPPMIMIIE